MFGICLRKGRSLEEWLEHGIYDAANLKGRGFQQKEEKKFSAIKIIKTFAFSGRNKIMNTTMTDK